MGLCSSPSCITQALYGALGSTTAVFCPKHADDGMVNVQTQRCLDGACLTCPSLNTKGNNTATYCEQHAQHDMVNVRNKLCSRALCTYEPFAKVARCKTEAHCKKHAEDEDAIVDVRRIDCSHSSRRKRPSYNYKGRKTTAFCKQHAEDGMVNIKSKRCSRVACGKRVRFDIQRNQITAYCRQHCEDDTFDGHTMDVPHDSGRSQPSWGNIAGDAGTVFLGPKSSCLDSAVMNLRELCKAEGCWVFPTRRVNENSLGHGCDDGPLKDGLVVTVRPDPIKCISKSSSSRLSYSALGDPLVHVKAQRHF